MAMTRGELVIVAAPGDYEKPRPAVIVRSNAIPEPRLGRDLPNDFRIGGGRFPHHDRARAETGLRIRSRAMADKPVTMGQERIGQRIGRLAAADMARLNVALALVMGLAD
jgi:mRNA interferase MazF